MRTGWHGNDHLRYTEPPDLLGQTIQFAQHAYSIQHAPVFVGIVIEKTHGAPVTAGVQFLGEACRSISGTQDQHGLAMQLEIAV